MIDQRIKTTNNKERGFKKRTLEKFIIRIQMNFTTRFVIDKRVKRMEISILSF